MVEVVGELEIASNNHDRDPGKIPPCSSMVAHSPEFSQMRTRDFLPSTIFLYFFFNWELLQPWSTGLDRAFWDDKLVRWSSQPINNIINHQNAWKYISLSLSSSLSADVCILLIGITLTDFFLLCLFASYSI